MESLSAICTNALLIPAALFIGCLVFFVMWPTTRAIVTHHFGRSEAGVNVIIAALFGISAACAALFLLDALAFPR